MRGTRIAELVIGVPSATFLLVGFLPALLALAGCVFFAAVVR